MDKRKNVEIMNNNEADSMVHSNNSKYREQFTQMSINASQEVVNSMRNNFADYKVIDSDKSLSAVDKAIAKRKLLAWDIGIGTGSIGSFLGLAWLAKKIFVA